MPHVRPGSWTAPTSRAKRSTRWRSTSARAAGHWGLYRSDDWGDSWHDVANGVPSDFGFAMAMHPHDPDTVYIVPLESDYFRCTPEAKLRDALATDAAPTAGVYFGTRSGAVYASADEGETWTVVHDGLPPVLCVKAGTLA